MLGFQFSTSAVFDFLTQEARMKKRWKRSSGKVRRLNPRLKQRRRPQWIKNLALENFSSFTKRIA